MKVFYNEFDKDASRWLRNLSEAGKVPKGFVDSRSIAELTPEELDQYDQAHFFAGIGGWPLALELAGVSPEADIWTGSCPCQPFSVAGQGKGVEDERHLWPVWRELIRECKPSIIFGEQVASKAGKDWLDAVRLDLEEMGYAVGAADLCAAGVGAPHIRQRVYFGAVRRVANSYNEGLQGYTRNGSSDDEQGRLHANPVGPTPTTSGNDGMEYADGVGFGHKIKDVWEVEPLGTDALYRVETPFGDGIEFHRARRADGRGADWLLCRDPSGVPRWRPVLSGNVEMVNGLSGRMVGVCGEEINEKKRRSSETLQVLPEKAPEKEIQQKAGRHDSLQSESLLRQGLYGEEYGGDEGSEREKQSKVLCVGGEGEMRELSKERHKTYSTSQRREPNEQQPVELEDVVRFLPQAITLAQLRQDKLAESKLQALRQAIANEGAVLDTQCETQVVWRSLTEESKNRVRMGFDTSEWRMISTIPLAHGVSGRVVKLRGYGNAIVPQLAATFIAAFMESL